MKIPYIKEDKLYVLKNSIINNLDKYNNNNNEWVQNFFKDEDYKDYLNLQIKDFDLKMYAQNEDELIKEDIDNCKILYTHFKDLSDSQATDERLWVGLTHLVFWKYMKHRFDLLNKNLDNGEKTETKIKVAYFFNVERDGNKRPLILNYLSRLWWMGRMIYDEKNPDPYELLPYFFHDQSSLLLWGSRSYTNNKNIVQSAINAISEYEKKGVEITRPIRNNIRKNLNIIGGVTLLDYLSENEVKEFVRNEIDSYLKQGQ